MTTKSTTLKKAVILFAGDSGDGIQLTGSQFTDTVGRSGALLSTFSDFPAEIRAPEGTVAGISGFQIHFGSSVYAPGDKADVLVVMNAAALKKNVHRVKKGGIIIADIAGFDKKNLRSAAIEENKNPLDSAHLSDYRVYPMTITKLTREILAKSKLGARERERSKNMFVLGFVYWLYDYPVDDTLSFLKRKFNDKPDILEANSAALKSGYHYGETTETFGTRFKIKHEKTTPGMYRNITGNHATAIGMIVAAQKAGLSLFFGSYPITPASDILHFLSRYKHYNVKVFQAEDEIAAIMAAIGASYGGTMGTTASSGPGMALKGEALGLAVMLEIPLLVINVQRGGPSTGLPTKTEQSDLLQAMYGRNGEAPIPVVAAKSPANCFQMVFEAIRIAITYMTPVIFMSDGYLANGSESWHIPDIKDLKKITPKKATKKVKKNGVYYPYLRDKHLVRTWAYPGMKGFESRLGGLEKEEVTGNVSYDAENHQKMVQLRQLKIENIAESIPEQSIDNGKNKGKLLVVSWGSSYGVVKTAVKQLLKENLAVSHLHVQYINPFPKNLGALLKAFHTILVPELNNGQLVKILRDTYLLNAISFTKVQGIPFTVHEIVTCVKRHYPETAEKSG